MLLLTKLPFKPHLGHNFHALASLQLLPIFKKKAATLNIYTQAYTEQLKDAEATSCFYPPMTISVSPSPLNQHASS